MSSDAGEMKRQILEALKMQIEDGYNEKSKQELPDNSKEREELQEFMASNGSGKEIKFMNANGEIEGSLPHDNELFAAIVGYQHDPETHNYNRAERRRIIKAAKELEKRKKNGRR